MYCRNCGNEIDPGAKFCQECGAPVQEPAQPLAGPEIIPEVKPKKVKKPFYKRWWFWVIVVILVLGSCGGISDSSKEVPTAAEPAPTTAAEPAPTTPATEKPSIEKKTQEIETTASATSSSEDIDTAIVLIESVLKENFDNYTISHEDRIITINVWEDGIALGAMLASAGNEEFQSSWAEMVENQKVFCNSVCDFVDTVGLEDVVVVVNILNDGNKDNVLLSVMEGIVIYDSVNGD